MRIAVKAIYRGVPKESRRPHDDGFRFAQFEADARFVSYDDAPVTLVLDNTEGRIEFRNHEGLLYRTQSEALDESNDQLPIAVYDPIYEATSDSTRNAILEDPGDVAEAGDERQEAIESAREWVKQVKLARDASGNLTELEITAEPLLVVGWPNSDFSLIGKLHNTSGIKLVYFTRRLAISAEYEKLLRHDCVFRIDEFDDALAKAKGFARHVFCKSVPSIEIRSNLILTNDPSRYALIYNARFFNQVLTGSKSGEPPPAMKALLDVVSDPAYNTAAICSFVSKFVSACTANRASRRVWSGGQFDSLRRALDRAQRRLQTNRIPEANAHIEHTTSQEFYDQLWPSRRSVTSVRQS